MRVLLAALLLAAAPAVAQERIVVAGSALAEIVVALGAGDRLVGRDTTVSFPESLRDLPDVGYLRALSAEGLLSLGPDMILADADAGPPETLALIEATEVPVVRVSESYSEAGVLARIDAVAAALQLDGLPLRTEVEAAFRDLAEARETAAPVRAIFGLSASGGRIMAAGQGTGAEGIFRLAGVENAITGVDGYR
ncbi:MAG: hemin ABC transporter substrate-binding protein, partial [Pararhodobacter sp.]